MIIQTLLKLEPGFRETGECETNDGNGDPYNLAFVVIREATKEEFIEHCRSLGVEPNIAPDVKYFYHVATD